MDSKALIGLSVTVGAVVAGGVYSFIHSDTAIQMSVGRGFVAGGVKLLLSYAKSSAARWTISLGVGAVAALLIPTIDWFISCGRSSAKIQPEQQRAINIDPKKEPAKIELEGKVTVENAYYYDEKSNLLPIVFYTTGPKREWVAALGPSKVGKSQHDRVYEDGKLRFDPLYNKDGARLVNLSNEPLYLDMKAYDTGKRLSYNPQAK